MAAFMDDRLASDNDTVFLCHGTPRSRGGVNQGNTVFIFAGVAESRTHLATHAISLVWTYGPILMGATIRDDRAAELAAERSTAFPFEVPS